MRERVPHNPYQEAWVRVPLGAAHGPALLGGDCRAAWLERTAPAKGDNRTAREAGAGQQSSNRRRARCSARCAAVDA